MLNATLRTALAHKGRLILSMLAVECVKLSGQVL